MRTAAVAITKLLNPVTTSFATVILVVVTQQISGSRKLLWLILGFLISAVPIAVIYFEHSTGKISSFWSPTAAERRNSYLVWVFAAAIFSGAAFWQQAPRLILALGLVFLILGLVNLIATWGFKISVHSELVTLFVITSVLSVSVSLILLAVLILLVAWSRLYLKAHTLSEITTGAFLAIFTVYFIFSFFGLATF